MDINTSNNAVFGRTIKVKPCFDKNYKYMKEISKILNGNKSQNYNEKQHEEIKNFFIDTLGDYNGKNNISLRKTTNGDVFLFSGNEAKKLREIEQIENLDTKKNKAAKYTQNIPLKSIEKVENFIYKQSENGNNYKPQSIFRIKSGNKGLEQIEYESYSQNYVPDKGSKYITVDNKKIYTNMLARISYEKKELNLKG